MRTRRIKRRSRPSSQSLTCPFCFESIKLVLDPTAGREQRFVYDCEVCCHPIVVTARFDGAELTELYGERES